MGGGTPRKSYTKIKNFTEKDQVRIKYSYIGKDKKLMLSVYIGEDVYNELTGGQKYERLKVEYIPNDMVIITPTDNEKEGIVHRYNGKGLFKTTCVRLSLSSYKTLKVRKKDFNNRVVGYMFSDRSYYKCLNVDLIGSKKPRFVSKFDVDSEYLDCLDVLKDSKGIEVGLDEDYENDMSRWKYIHSGKPLNISVPDFNDIREDIDDKFLIIEERLEKRIQLLESLLKEFTDQPLPPLKPSEENSLDIDILKKISNNITDVMNFKLSKIESGINELIIKNIDLISRLNLLLQKLEDKTADPEYMSFRFMEIKDLLNQIKKSHEHKSLFERIFGKD